MWTLMSARAVGRPGSRVLRAFLGASPVELSDALEQQRDMLQERRRQIDGVLAAVDRARLAIGSDGQQWDSVVNVIRAIQMSQKDNWQSKYFTDEQRQAMEKLSEGAYTPEAKEALDARPVWTEDDQKRVDAQDAALYDGVK